MDALSGLVVVVEDERAIADLERLYLTRAGFGVEVVGDGDAALAVIRTRRPVAIVLDVGLPGVDGIELCRRLRADDDWTPIIFVTARDDEIERLVALELGGDDYLTKPFSPRELVTRLKVVLRRTHGVARLVSGVALGLGALALVVEPGTHGPINLPERSALPRNRTTDATVELAGDNTMRKECRTVVTGALHSWATALSPEAGCALGATSVLPPFSQWLASTPPPAATIATSAPAIIRLVFILSI